MEQKRLIHMQLFFYIKTHKFKYGTHIIIYDQSFINFQYSLIEKLLHNLIGTD